MIKLLLPLPLQSRMLPDSLWCMAWRAAARADCGGATCGMRRRGPGPMRRAVDSGGEDRCRWLYPAVGYSKNAEDEAQRVEDAAADDA